MIVLRAPYPREEKTGRIHYQRIADLLGRVVYAGHLEMPEWKVSLRKAKHEGLISLQTFEKIQRRLKEGGKAPARKDISADFPLRGFVLCGDCSKPLTACWSKSKTGKRHPYYLCATKGCASYRKSIRRDEIEDAFADNLRQLQPADNVFALARAMFKDAWSQRHTQAKVHRDALERDLAKTEKQIEGLLDRIVDAGNPQSKESRIITNNLRFEIDLP